MLLNRIEKALMNNTLRAAIQRRVETPLLIAMGGRIDGGTALEVGCGRGVGVEILLDVFGARRVDAFDLDPDMVALARRRLAMRGDAVKLWEGDASRIDAPDATYDAVFDFGILHHVPDWRSAVAEVARVLRPGGRFYAEEVLRAFIIHPIVSRVLEHPLTDRFDHEGFRACLAENGLRSISSRRLWRILGWYVAEKRGAW